jgi:adenylosuccinate lyase
MIERYQVNDISKIWSRENRFKKWLDVELAITEVWYEWGEVPEKSYRNIEKNANFDVHRIDEIERKVQHDVIAFLTSIEEFVGADSAYIHKGVTSYDIVDTAFSLLIRESLNVVIKKAEKLAVTLLDKAFDYKDLVAIGRTHGVHAEPITFGTKYLIWFEEVNRNIQRLLRAREIISVGKMSGSVGTYIHFPPQGEQKALKKLNLKPCRVSSQIIQRDRHMEVLYALASLGSAIEKIAVEFRHLQRTEVLEVEEPFSKGQKGSSSMPHKRNPVKCERISGLARLLRGNLSVAFENNVLWHERDISHSSAERIVFPDSFHAITFMLNDILYVVKNLNVYPENIRRNVDFTREVYFSQRVLTLLVEKGIARQKAYEIVQQHALKSWREKKSFRELIRNDSTVNQYCSLKEIDELFSEKDFIKGVNRIFKRFERDTAGKRNK